MSYANQFDVILINENLENAHCKKAEQILTAIPFKIAIK